MYGNILTEREMEFLRKFRDLSENARCLYVRLSNRHARFFKFSALSYEEIGALDGPLRELSEAGFIHEISSDSTVDYEDFLALFTKPELLSIARVLDKDLCPPGSVKKPDLVRWLHYAYRFEQVFTCISDQIIMPARGEEVMMLKFLFFGNRHDDMTEFVIRDLGHVRFQNFDEDKLSVRFSTRKEAEDRFMISLQAEYFEQHKKELPSEEVYDWFMNWQIGTAEHLSEIALPAYYSLVLKVGAWLERSKLQEQALTVYQLTDQPPARERRARLLHKLGLQEEARALSELMLADPQNSDERYFGIDFLERIRSSKKKVVKSTTRLLNQAETLDIEVAYRYQVEYGVINYYLQQGYHAVFSENEPWRAVFGLLFWDIIYDTNVQAIHHPLQRIPSDFFQPDFYIRRREQLAERLETMHTPAVLISHLYQVWHDKNGITNVMVSWFEEVLMAALKIAEVVPLEHLKTILMEMAVNLRENARGFPDLLIWKEDEYMLVEVKSPTDHLSARQLRWLEAFADMGIHSKVVRVAWV